MSSPSTGKYDFPLTKTVLWKEKQTKYNLAHLKIWQVCLEIQILISEHFRSTISYENQAPFQSGE